MVIVDQADHGNLFALGLLRRFGDKAVADQVADRLAASRIALAGVALIKGGEQGAFEGDADAC